MLERRVNAVFAFQSRSCLSHNECVGPGCYICDLTCTAHNEHGVSFFTFKSLRKCLAGAPYSKLVRT